MQIQKSGFFCEQQGDWHQVFFQFPDGERANLGGYHASLDKPESHARRCVETLSNYDKGSLTLALKWDDYVSCEVQQRIVDTCFSREKQTMVVAKEIEGIVSWRRGEPVDAIWDARAKTFTITPCDRMGPTTIGVPFDYLEQSQSQSKP